MKAVGEDLTVRDRRLGNLAACADGSASSAEIFRRPAFPSSAIVNESRRKYNASGETVSGLGCLVGFAATRKAGQE